MVLRRPRMLGKLNVGAQAERYLPDVMHALLHMDNVFELAGSRLCELRCVEVRMNGGGALREAEALKGLLLEILDELISELRSGGKATVWQTILSKVKEGKSITKIACEDLDRRRETVQRGPWPEAALLVSWRLLSLEKDVK